MLAQVRLVFAALSSLAAIQLLAPAALAQGPLGATPSISVAEAQRRFEEGVQAYDQKNYEAARVAFAQAYALEPLPELLVNLGHMELRTARYVEGARHLSQALREANIEPDERSKAEDALKAAEQQVGRVQITPNVDGVTLVIDDDKVGTSPMIYAWYVEPGEHRVRASKKGYAPHDEVFGVSKGQTKQIQLLLKPMAGTEPETDAGGATEPTDTAQGSHREMTPVLVGGGLTLVGLGTGIAFAVLAGSDRSDRDHALKSLQADAGLPNPCADGTAFASRCGRINESDRSARHRQVTSDIGFGVGGVAAVATLAYWFWPRSAGTTASSVATELAITPVVSPTALLLNTSGSF